MTFVNAYGGVREEGNERVQNDHYPTPPVATYALLKSHKVPRKLWEPAAGRGWMAWELERNGHEVIKSDLYEYPNPVVTGIETDVDFLRPGLTNFLQNDGPDTVGIITNPPYGKNQAQKFIEKARENYPFVAVLCRLMFAESGVRLPMFVNDPPSDVYIFSARFSCEEKRFLDRPLNGMVSYAWWVFDNESRNTAKMHWMNTKSLYEDWKFSMTSEKFKEMENYIGN